MIDNTGYNPFRGTYTRGSAYGGDLPAPTIGGAAGAYVAHVSGDDYRSAGSHPNNGYGQGNTNSGGGHGNQNGNGGNSSNSNSNRPPAGSPGSYEWGRQQGQSVFDWARETLATWGMDSPEILDAIRNARNEYDMMAQIRDSAAYKERFAGNIARANAGFGMLSEAQYLAQEEAYRQAMHAAGLPKKFYDSPEDFANLMAGDVSPAEVTARAELAGSALTNKDPEFVKAMKRMYGLTKGEISAYALDPDRALPILERRFAAMEVGAEAGRFDIKGAGNKKWMNRLVSQGVDQAAARQAFARVDEISGDVSRLAGIEDVKATSERQLANAELGVGSKKSRRLAKRDNALRSQERARQSGGSGGAGVFGSSTSGF